MYVGDPDDVRRRRLDDLEMLLHGYAIAVVSHGMQDPGGVFLGEFGEYLRGRFGWSMSCGAVDAIRRAAHDESAAWTMFWKLVGEYRKDIERR